MDFVLKILTVNGKKIRVQLWEMAGGANATTLAPLFIRNAVGCVIVARADQEISIRNCLKWKENFDN